MNKKNFNVIDLFCGCGGLSQGFSDAGFKILLGIDNDDAALRTFEANHSNSKAVNIDLSSRESASMIKKAVNDQPVDVIIAGPPCQGFSLTGPRNFDDNRNKLYLAVIELVHILKPKAFLIENVPGLATLYGGQVKDEIIRRFSDIYNVEIKILLAADYGIPQMRRRVFFVGLRKEYGFFSFPTPIVTPEEYVTCSDAISDLPSREKELGNEFDSYENEPLTNYQKQMRKNTKILSNHVATNHTELIKDIIALVPEGGNYRNLPAGIGDNRKFHEAWTRYHSNKPSRTIDTGHRNHFHYKYNRVPTIRENARLQSFRDNFVFYGTRTEQNRQVGNAVPPLLGYHIAKAIQKHLNSKSNDA